jgi:hypothetical protein
VDWARAKLTLFHDNDNKMAERKNVTQKHNSQSNCAAVDELWFGFHLKFIDFELCIIWPLIWKIRALLFGRIMTNVILKVGG